MRYEVEMKFPVDDMTALESRLTELGATISSSQTEIDVYFAHPVRDFAQTDEALRIRRKGSANSITYKGPKIDAVTKTRHEIDLPLLPDEPTAQAWMELLNVLGFIPAGEVQKSRRKAFIVWQDRRVEASLDEIEGLGQFAELELVVDSTEMEAARTCIMSLAKSLGLTESQRKSYLELLLERTGGQ